MKFIAPDSAHAGHPYNFLKHAGFPYNFLSYFLSKLDISFRTVGIKRKIANELDGLECIIPASMIIERESINDRRLANYKLFLEKSRKRFGEDFGYYAFHGLYEDSPDIIKDFNVNLADNNTHEKAKGIETVIINQMRIAKDLSCAEKPILNLHMGWVEDEKQKEERIKNLKGIVEACLGEDSSVLICFENAPPAEEGYNLFQEMEDFDMVRAPGTKVTDDTSHLECARYKKRKGKKYETSEENMREYNVFHNKFISKFKNEICYMHLSFNDTVFLEPKEKLDPFYKEDRHSPPSRFMNSIFAENAFESVTRNALETLEENMDEESCICIEVPRKKVFFRTYCINGATEKELIESYRYARKIYKDMKAEEAKIL